MPSSSASFPSLAAYSQALNALGARKDGPDVLAISSGDTTALFSRKSRREGNWHSHLRGQVINIEDGLAHVRTQAGAWLVPPQRAVWIPPEQKHAVNLNGVTRSWSLYVSPRASAGLPAQPCVLMVNGLIQELVQRAVSWTWEARLLPPQRRMLAVLLDEVRRAPRDPMHLPMPSDRRALRIANAIIDEPADARTRDEWAAWAGLSARTLSRLFQAELNTSFAQWREQAVLLAAMERLLQGESVGVVSDALGYATPSSFIAMFRRHFGDSPAHYMAQSARAA